MEEHRSLKAGSTTLWYKLNDGTNSKPVIALRSFRSASRIEDTEKVVPDDPRTLPRRRYVSIVGTLVAPKNTRDSPSISCDGFRVVTDPHEPYAHVLGVLYTALCIKKGAPVSTSN